MWLLRVKCIYPIKLEINATDVVKSVWYLDIHLEIDNGDRLKTIIYNNKKDFSFPIVNFPFLCWNIPTASPYWVYICKLLRYSRACISYHKFCDRALKLTRKLLNEEFKNSEVEIIPSQILMTPPSVGLSLFNIRFTDDTGYVP